MSAPQTVADLQALLERSGLLSAAQLEPVFADALDPDLTFQRLRDDRLLTPFQADQLRQGRATGFFLTDKYKVLDFIGSGGMGKVYLCEHLLLHRLVAVKLLQLPTGPGADAARSFDRFYREARAVAALNDPNIIRVFDVDRVGPNPFMVMEYADGTNLHDIVSRHGALPPIRAADYARQAALGLQHAHDVGLVHRDVKPGNLLLDRSGTVKLLDLGLARFTQDPSRNAGLTDKYDKHIVLGTVDFMAPEQAFDTPAVDGRSDIYALGCTLYYLLTGQVPFPDRSVPEKMYAHKTRAPAPVSELAPRVPAGLVEVLERMMAKDPADRYQTPAEVVEVLAEWVTEMVPAPPDREMPKHPASFYRIGLSETPDMSAALAVTPNPLSGLETDRTPRPGVWNIPGFDTPERGHRPGTGDDPSLLMAPQPPTLAQPRLRAARRQRRLVRLGELLLFVLAAGAVGWLASREWMHADRQGPADPGPAAAGPTGPFAGPILNAGGVSFADPVMQRWAAVYEKRHGVRLDYQPVGIGKGVQGAIDRVYRFGCTVVFLTDEELAAARIHGGDMIHVPLALGAVAVAYNLPDVAEPLRFTGPVLADIYLGKITRWNDPALAIANPGAALPDLPITVVYHGDPTGTTYLWTDYLSESSAEWRKKHGPASAVAWPVGRPAPRGNSGAAALVSRMAGAIGYVEQSFALANNLRVGRVRNQDGQFVPPTPAGVTAAAATVLPTVRADLRYSLTDAPGEGVYPIAGTVWAILYTDQTGRATGPELVDFLRWATHEGQTYATELQFAPLPPDLVKRIDDRLAAVRVR
jgi:phosphate ABC transporter phosphate-binding protein